MSVFLSAILTAAARACPGAVVGAVCAPFAQDTGPFPTRNRLRIFERVARIGPGRILIHSLATASMPERYGINE
jgi:hypothetical protein